MRTKDEVTSGSGDACKRYPVDSIEKEKQRPRHCLAVDDSKKNLHVRTNFQGARARGQDGMLSLFQKFEIRRSLRREDGHGDLWDEMVCDWHKSIDGKRG
jgi:hypothetical protein